MKHHIHHTRRSGSGENRRNTTVAPGLARPVPGGALRGGGFWLGIVPALALLLGLLSTTPAQAAPGVEIAIHFTFDRDHHVTGDVSTGRALSGEGLNHLRGDPEDADFVTYTDGGRITAFVGRNRNIVLNGNNSKKVNAGSTAYVDLFDGFGCAENGGTSVRVDIDDLAGCDPCTDTTPLLPDTRFGSLDGADVAGLPDNIRFLIYGEDFDDLAIDCSVTSNASLEFSVDGQEWQLWWGPYKRPGQWTYNPDADPIKIVRVSTSEWRFQTTGEHRAALYRDNNPPHRATEYHGQFMVRFSGTAIAISDPGPTPAADEHCDILMTLGDSACVPPLPAPTVTIIDPVDGSEFESGALVTFSATATDDQGNDVSHTINWFLNDELTAFDAGASTSLDFSLIGDGVHTITAEATDANGTGSDAVTIMVGAPPPASTVSVPSITYATSGGRLRDKHLLVTVSLVDGASNPVSDASVSIDLFRDDTLDSQATGATGTDGTVTFERKNAPSGTYTTVVMDVTAAGLTWDGLTPPNSFTK